MTLSTHYISLTILTILVTTSVACKTINHNTTNPVSVNDDIIHLVNIYTLTDNIKKYHGLTVQTTGYFNLQFEDCSLSRPSIVFENNKFTFSIKDFQSLWVDFDYNPTTFKRIETLSYRTSGRLTTLQGIIDTTKTGHMGFYIATLAHAKIIESN